MSILSTLSNISEKIVAFENKVLGGKEIVSSPITTKEALGMGLKSAAVAVPITTAATAPALISGAVSLATKTPSLVVQYPKTSAVVAGTAYLASKSSRLSNDILNAPKSVDTFASNVGELYDNPSIEQAKETFKESPVISGALIAGTGLLIGKGVSNTIATFANTAAVKENTKVATAAGSNLLNSNLTSQTAGTSMSAPVSAVPAYNYLPTETMTKSYGNKNITTYKRKKTKTLYSSPVKVYNRIMVLNKNG